MKRARSEGAVAGQCSAPRKRRRRSLPSETACSPLATICDQRIDILRWARAVSDAGPAQHQHINMADRPPRIPSPCRRTQKSHYRRRSVSPTKKPVEYRSIHLTEAAIVIDHCHDPPAAANLDSIALSLTLEAEVALIAQDFCNNCRESAKDGAGENEWRADLVAALMHRLARLSPWKKILKMSASEKPWRAELKPLRSTATSLAPPMPPPISLAPDPNAALVTSLSFMSSVPTTSPLQNDPADAFDVDTLSDTVSTTTTSMSTIPASEDDCEALSTPKPDLSIGLAHTWFSTAHQRLLARLLPASDPHQAKMGLHFPFLIFEAKGSGSLFGAQNQAAVGAACMLKILDTLGCADFVFSVTTEGPVHELWVHHRLDEKYHSTFVDVWRTTTLNGATRFMLILARILTWGAGPLAQKVLQSLNGID